MTTKSGLVPVRDTQEGAALFNPTECVAKRTAVEDWEGPSYQDILDEDEKFRPTSEIQREHRVLDLGTRPYSAARYTDPEFFKKEVKHVFLRTWQYACREEEIANPGDTYIFDLVGRSLLVARQPDGSIRALENICLHRGRKLATTGGCKKHFRCPYHGFTWELNGAFQPGPASWDFPQIDPKNFRLGEARVESWAGFVFVNFDLNAPPLLDVLDPLPRHMSYWKIEKCYKAAHVAKELNANWKVVNEAFLENHHVTFTHPQVAAYTMDANAQYDILSDHITRHISPHGFPGMLYEGPKLSPEEILEVATRNGNKAGDASGGFDGSIPERQYLASVGRANLEQRTGMDFSDRPDADFIDGVSHDLFPNFHIWGSLSNKISYRFRPLDHETTLMETFLYKLTPAEGAPPPARMRMLAPEEKWSEAFDQLSYLAGVYDQDESNMVPVQEGLRALGDRPVNFSRYSEIRCRNLHRMVDVYIARGEAEEATAAS
jgi:phenylpropionate dioxygenase-like ring-hydroxylating dioxygenase large terminal subunit